MLYQRTIIFSCLLLIVYGASAREIHSVKKGVGSGSADRVELLNCSWYYNWNMKTNDGANPIVEYVPMRHNRYWPGWDKLATCGDFDYILGYNEPERSNQGNITVEKAIIQWPNMEAASVTYDALLGSPATANPMDPWIIDFMNQVETNGYQVDFMTMHKYPKPESTGSVISGARDLHEAYGRDVWITEFNAADWSAPNDYSFGDSYTWMVELLYRMEATDYIKRYAIFPWDGSGSVSEASPVFVPGTDTLTPLGELYANYRSSDVNGPYADTWYYLHSKKSKGRMNDSFSAASSNLYEKGFSADFKLEDAGSGEWFIISRTTGLRLGSGGSSLFWSAEDDASVRWTLSDADHCWKYIDHVGSAKRLMADSSGLVDLVDAVETGGDVQWSFIRSYESKVNDLNFIIWQEFFSSAPRIDVDDEPHFNSEWEPGTWLAKRVHASNGALHTNQTLRLCAYKYEPNYGKTQVYGYVLDESLFNNRAGTYFLDFDIPSRSHSAAYLGVKIYNAEAGEGDENSYYWSSYVGSRGVEGSVSASGTAVVTPLSTNNVFYGGNDHSIEFDYDGDGDVVLLFSSMSDARWLGGGLYSDIDNLRVYGQPNAFELWLDGYGVIGEEFSPYSDADGDGVNNFVEYAINGNPTNYAEQGIKPSWGDRLSAGGTNWLEYVHVERTTASNGLVYTLEHSYDLLSQPWSNLTDAVWAGEGAVDADYKSVTNRIPIDGKTTEFIRVQVSQ